MAVLTVASHQIAAHIRAVPISGHDESVLASGEPGSNSPAFANISIGRRPARLFTEMKNLEVPRLDDVHPTAFELHYVRRTLSPVQALPVVRLNSAQ